MQDPPQQLRQGLRARPAWGGQEGGGEAEAPNQESKRGEDEFFLLESWLFMDFFFYYFNWTIYLLFEISGNRWLP